MQLFKRPAEILVHGVQAQFHVVGHFFFGHSVRDAAQDGGLLVGKVDAFTRPGEVLEGLEHHACDLRVERHAALRHVIEGAQDFRRASGLDEIAVSAGLERGEDFFTIVKGREYENPAAGKLFAKQADAFQSDGIKPSAAVISHNLKVAIMVSASPRGGLISARPVRTQDRIRHPCAPTAHMLSLSMVKQAKTMASPQMVAGFDFLDFARTRLGCEPMNVANLLALVM